MIASTSRISTMVGISATRRTFSLSSRAHAKAPLAPTAEIANPVDLLAKIGRGTEKRLAAQAESWDSLNSAWLKGSEGIKSSGLSVRDRRYVMWAFSRFSQGGNPAEFLSGPRAVKKIRG